MPPARGNGRARRKCGPWPEHGLRRRLRARGHDARRSTRFPARRPRFGTDWCGFCSGAQPAIEAALAAHPDLRHIKVEDGSGRPLGRSFRIKLWPTLVLLRDGEEVARVVRPSSRAEVDRAVELLDPPA